MRLWMLTTLLLLSPIRLTETGDAMLRFSYRAAVYEHVIILPTESQKAVNRSVALEAMSANLDVYDIQANLAKSQEADILVFPEDGIYGMFLSRDAIYPYLESIPDPENITWSPCADPTRFPETEVQHRLSCMALKNNMYIAADMGDKITCDKRKDPKCPEDGRYQYNTAVVYDPDGTLVARYHKRHLFYESQFDQPEVEVKFFDTPFGRFGLAVCFDLLFRDPVVAMMTSHNVTNLLFPTAWSDALPLLSAIGYHSSVARGLGVNLMGANVHLPLLKFHGSGVYTPKGMASFYYNNNLMSTGKLMVAEIDSLKKSSVMRRASSSRIDTKINKVPLSLNEGWLNGEDEFFADVFHDRFKFRVLQDISGEIRVCDGRVCCHLKYEMIESKAYLFKDLFALGVFDGLHTYQGQYYLQVCTLLKCASNIFKSYCGAKTFESSTIFKSLYIQGEFQTEYVYPQVVLSNNGQLELAGDDEWDFFSPDSNSRDGGEKGEDYQFVMSSSSSEFKKPLLSATMFGRYYSRDNGTTRQRQGRSGANEKNSVLSSVFNMFSVWYKFLRKHFFSSI